MQRPAVSLALLPFTMIAMWSFGCGAPESTPDEPVVIEPDGLAAGRHVFVAADGVEMPYEVSGEGETTVVLVHCWMCDRTFWKEQLPALRGGYRVVTLDLPGHGEGGDTRESWSIEGYGQDVAGLIEHVGLDRVVLVGHSMGGPVSLKAAALAGDRVVGIVAVDTLHDAEFDFTQPQFEQIMTAFESDFRGVCTTMVDQMFPEEGVEEVVAEVRRKGCEESNEEAGKALMRDFGSIDLPRLFEEAGVPIRAINAAAPNPTRTEINRKYADFDVVLMEDVGHYPHMTRPEEFNAHLLLALSELQ